MWYAGEAASGDGIGDKNKIKHKYIFIVYQQSTDALHRRRYMNNVDTSLASLSIAHKPLTDPAVSTIQS